MSFDVLVARRKIVLESSHRMNKHVDMIVEVLEVQISVAFELCIEEELI